MYQHMTMPNGSMAARDKKGELLLAQSELSLMKQELVYRAQKAVERNDVIRKDKSDSTKHVVSDHALVRWLERVQGIDVVALKDKILSIAPLPEDLKARGSYVFRGEYVYIYSGTGTLATVVGNNQTISQEELDADVT